jgi:predicted HAD superfamily Cof-like phosphohydrolase
MKQHKQVQDFHIAFGHPVKTKPTLLDSERVKNRSNWMKEEINEFENAKTIVDQADAMIDCMYFVLGTLVEMGVDPEPLFDIVQAANMAKLGPDGKPIYKPDGKVAKPKNWQPPEPLLEREIERQLKQ